MNVFSSTFICLMKNFLEIFSVFSFAVKIKELIITQSQLKEALEEKKMIFFLKTINDTLVTLENILFEIKFT